jgi:hypothetical protein
MFISLVFSLLLSVAGTLAPMDTAGGTPFDTAGGTPFTSATPAPSAPTASGSPVQAYDTAGGTPF